MTEKNVTVICRIYRILLSISVIAAGLCLILGCLSIYYSKDLSYSRQAVAQVFNTIAVPVYICLGLSAVSLVLGVLFPAFSVKHNPKISYKNRLSLLLSKKDFKALSGKELSAIEKERKKRRLITALQAVAVSVACLVFLIYALNGEHYDNSDINGSVINAMWVLLPCLVVIFAVSVLAEIFRSKSFRREIEQVKKLPSVKSNSAENISGKNKGDIKISVIRCAILLLSIGILIYGFATGGVYDVLTKAVNICTECIGLG